MQPRANHTSRLAISRSLASNNPELWQCASINLAFRLIFGTTKYCFTATHDSSTHKTRHLRNQGWFHLYRTISSLGSYARASLSLLPCKQSRLHAPTEATPWRLNLSWWFDLSYQLVQDWCLAWDAEVWQFCLFIIMFRYVRLIKISGTLNSSDTEHVAYGA